MDIEYLMRRMTEERQRAAEADSDAARAAHLALAEQYRRQIDEWGDESEADAAELRSA
jgi:hypothetical protein